MTTTLLTRPNALAGAAVAAGAVGLARPARAAPPKITFLTSWFAEAEHGGFYQAKATGLYEKAGLDVTIKMGGPSQQHAAADWRRRRHHHRLRHPAAQLDRESVAGDRGCRRVPVGPAGPDDPRRHPIDRSAEGPQDPDRVVVPRHVLALAQAEIRLHRRPGRRGHVQLQPFLIDKTVAMQGYPSSEPFEAMKAKEKVNFFLFADQGYPPYSNTLIATNSLIEKNPDAVAAFVKCSMLGWVDYFKNRAPANVLIKRDNPKEPDDQIAFAIEKLKEMRVLDRGEAAKNGIGSMTMRGGRRRGISWSRRSCSSRPWTTRRRSPRGSPTG